MSRPLTLAERDKLGIRRDHASEIERARALYDVEDDGYYRGVGFGLTFDLDLAFSFRLVCRGRRRRSARGVIRSGTRRRGRRGHARTLRSLIEPILDGSSGRLIRRSRRGLAGRCRAGRGDVLRWLSLGGRGRLESRLLRR